MPLFTSIREKRLWRWTLAVILAIFSTLVLGRPLAGLVQNSDLAAALFLFGMILVGATVLVHGLKTRPGKTEIVLWLGIAAVYLMFLLRLAIPERSHLIEYSVLALFIHEILLERFNQGKQIRMPALLAILITALIGALDEGIQLFLPSRVFDPVDIFFNTMAALMAVGSSVLLKWTRRRMARR